MTIDRTTITSKTNERTPCTSVASPAQPRAGLAQILIAMMVTLLLGMAAAQPDGADVFSSNCSVCHQSDGQGLTGTFPPLADVVPRIFAAENGRTTLIRILLFGMQGEITISGATYNGNMPSWGASLSDEEIAAVLNHELTAWENSALLPEDFAPIEGSEVAAEREADLTAAEVREAFVALEIDW